LHTIAREEIEKPETSITNGKEIKKALEETIKKTDTLSPLKWRGSLGEG